MLLLYTKTAFRNNCSLYKQYSTVYLNNNSVSMLLCVWSMVKLNCSQKTYSILIMYSTCLVLQNRQKSTIIIVGLNYLAQNSFSVKCQNYRSIPILVISRARWLISASLKFGFCNTPGVALVFVDGGFSMAKLNILTFPTTTTSTICECLW